MKEESFKKNEDFEERKEESKIKKEKLLLKNSYKNISKKLNIIFYSYKLTYKSLSIQKVFSFWLSILLGLVFLFLGLNKLSEKYLISIPAFGGTFNEGVLGTPRYVNPVLASSDIDKDLSRLIYSGLLKKDKNGDMVPDLASEIIESEDHLTYTIKIKPEAKFQDGTKIKAEDVIFTVSKIEDKNINSPLYINFEGVDVEALADDQIAFHLKKPYIYFKESLSFGVLPKHLWADISSEQFSLSQLNIEPVGSGPFKIKKILRDGNFINQYSLISFKEYLPKRPFINKINIKIYRNEKDLLTALKNDEIEATSYLSPSGLTKINKNNYSVLQSSLPNMFLLLLNPAKNDIFTNFTERSAFNIAINKEDLVNNVLSGYAKKAYFLEGLTPDEEFLEAKNDFLKSYTSTSLEDSLSRVDLAKAILENYLSKNKKSINFNEKTINITTADIEELKNTAEKVAEYWRALGFNVNVNIYSLSDITDIIKNRNFEVLLFGSIIEHDTDLYAYWHSSQRSYPGLNITNYASKNLDKNLEILKTSLESDTRKEALDALNKELEEELPAIPLYSNSLNYLIKNPLSDNIKLEIPKISKEKSDRYLNIDDWYLYKEDIWRFSNNQNLIKKLENLIH